MKTRNAVIGLSALGLMAFASGYSAAGGLFVFEGNAQYCVSHRDENATCVMINADMQITAENDISSAWIYAQRNGRPALKTLEQAGTGKAMRYVTVNEMFIFGNVTGLSLAVRDAVGNQAEHLFDKVDCRTLDNMINQ
ncbi:MAG: hypothetical protein KJ955_06840 [Nanoarchaeota archaeon]|nr:hypothetical protein [Nanoarchaeota archaeon]